MNKFVLAITIAAATAQDAVKTNTYYGLDNLDQAQGDVAAWYETVAKPFIDSHRDVVYRTALAEIEQEKGKLLETCEKGTACREEVTRNMNTIIQQQWQTLMKSFRQDVETNVLRTKEIVSENWDKLVQCEEDNKCCEVPVEIWNSVNTQITNTQKLITEKQTQIQQVQVEIDKMVTMCQDEVDFDSIVVDQIVQVDNDSTQATNGPPAL